MKISNRENFNIEISRFYFYSQIMNQFNYHPIMIYLMKYIQITMDDGDAQNIRTPRKEITL